MAMNRDEFRVGWSAAGLLALVHFAAFADRALPSAMAPLMKSDLGLSDAAIGALQGPAFIILYVIVLLMAGHWIGRFNPWRVAAGCVAVWTTGGILFALAPDYWGLVAGRILLGAGQAAFAPAALMILGAQTAATGRTRSLSLLTSGSAAGRSGAMLLSGLLLASLGSTVVFGLVPWRWVCLVLVAPNLLLILALLLVGQGAACPPFARGGLGPALSAVLRRPAAFLSVAACGAGCVLLVQAVGAWAPSILNRSYGLEPAQAAAAFGVMILIFAPAGHMAAGWLLSSPVGMRAGTGSILAAALMLAALGAWGLARAPNQTAAAGFLCLSISAGGLAAALCLITLQELVDAALKAAVGALFLAVTSVVGVGGGPWITGLISDGLSMDGHALAHALALTILPVAALAGLIGLWAGPRVWRPVKS